MDYDMGDSTPPLDAFLADVSQSRHNYDDSMVLYFSITTLSEWLKLIS